MRNLRDDPQEHQSKLTGVLVVVVSDASKYKLLKLGLWLLICIWFVGGHHRVGD